MTGHLRQAIDDPHTINNSIASDQSEEESAASLGESDDESESSCSDDDSSKWSLDDLLTSRDLSGLFEPYVANDSSNGFERTAGRTGKELNGDYTEKTPKEEEAELINDIIGWFERGDAQRGFLMMGGILLCDELDAHTYSGFHEDCVVLRNPSLRDLRFLCSSETGEVTAIQTKTWKEVFKMDCGAGEARRKMILFLIEWSKTHPPQPSTPPSRPSLESLTETKADRIKLKKTTARSILTKKRAERASGRESRSMASFRRLSAMLGYGVASTTVPQKTNPSRIDARQLPTLAEEPCLEE